MSHLKELINAPVITIDGPSGSGKGAVSLLLAKILHWNLLDSGALYRVLAYAAFKHDVKLDDALRLEKLAIELDVQFIPKKDNFSEVVLEKENVSAEIRTESIGNAASTLAIIPKVRTALLSRQRIFREGPGLVADGRDMGTVVFPDAKLKIFLLASKEIRAERRFNQLKEQGVNVNLGDLIEELSLRDKRDQERLVAPLKPADDAVCIDTDRLTIEQVVERILSEMKAKKAFPATLNQAIEFPIHKVAE